jgi:hypothetical protein
VKIGKQHVFGATFKLQVATKYFVADVNFIKNFRFEFQLPSGLYIHFKNIYFVEAQSRFFKAVLKVFLKSTDVLSIID